IMLSYASSDGRIKESDFSKAPASVLPFRLVHHRPRQQPSTSTGQYRGQYSRVRASNQL
ncbi:hypothetical protein V3C99_017161, partial [Haemonchus contortus]